MFSIYAYGLFAAAFVLFLYRVLSARRLEKLALFGFFLIIGALYFSVSDPASLTALTVGIVIFDGLMFTYGKRLNYLYVALGIAYIAVFHSVGMNQIAQAMLIGLLAELNMFKRSLNKATTKSVEIKRDLVQVVGGVGLIIAFFAFSSGYAYLVLIGAIMLGFFLVCYSVTFRRSSLAKRLYKYEREYTTFGQGAIWLALGSLVAVGFASTPYSIAILACLFIGDAVATIAGLTYGKAKLFYNRKKSVIGTLAYAVSAFLVSLIFVQPWIALLIAVVGAVVESLPKHMDDNFDVAVVLALMLLALGAVGLIH